jgi:F-type H+-transporting ATPase subunit gamma
MASLKNIKLKILSVKKTSTVTHAMEAVSAVKMRKSQERALAGRLYAASALTILQKIAGTADFKQHPLMMSQSAQSVYIIVTSDKGLAGSLNSAVIRKAEAAILGDDKDNHAAKKNNARIIAIGRRGADYFASRGYNVVMRKENVSDSVSESDMYEITSQFLQWHKDKQVNDLFVVYTNFLSTFEQQAISRRVVPIVPEAIAEMIKNIRPAKGKYAPSASDKSETTPTSYTIEPNADTIIDVLLPKLINVAIFHALLENKASEHSARMVAMKNATDNAKEKAREYTRTFNKVRQAAITREISEITSGIEAMR